MSQMTAVGVIAKGSRDACITLARILLPDGCQIEKKGKRQEITFAVESRPVSLLDDAWNGLECGILMIRYEDDFSEYVDEDENDEDECEIVYERKNILEISEELQLDVKILNIPLEQDYPSYIHIVNGQCKKHIIYASPYDDEVVPEDYDEDDFEDDGEKQYLTGCDPQYRPVDKLEGLWDSHFVDIYEEYGFGDCFDEMCPL